MQPGTILNPALLSRQGIDDEGRKAILAKHDELDAAVACVDALPADDARIPALLDAIAAAEFELQDLWGFERAVDMHSHWHRPAACRCDRTVNRLMWRNGVRARAVRVECPLHGGPNYRPDGVAVVRQVLPGDRSAAN